MKKTALVAIAALGLLVLIVGASPAQASPVRVVLSSGVGVSHTVSADEGFTARDESMGRFVLDSSNQDNGWTRHIGVFSDRIKTDVADVTSTPEPGTLVLLGSGLLLMGLAVRHHMLA